MDEKTGEEVYVSVGQVALGAKPGDRLQVYDAYSLKRIFDLTVPETQSKKGLERKLKPHFGELARYLKRTSSAPRARSGQIRLPQFLTMVGGLRSTNSSNTRVLVFGKPYYRDERDEAFNFGDGLYPNDGHLLASPNQSVFGTAGLEKLLAGATVDFCYLSEENFHSGLEKPQIVRFWTLYTERLGAVLTTCASDYKAVVESALSDATDAKTPSDFEIDLNDTKIEMREVGARRAEMDASSSAPLQETPELVEVTSEQAELIETAKAVPKPKAGVLSIAAVWISEDEKADVDLWVLPNPMAEEIYFGRAETPEGRLHRDIRASNEDLVDGNWKASWEVVEVNGADLEDATCWINLYLGSGAKIEGLVRLLFDGQSVDVPFHFDGEGDQGSATVDRAKSKFWTPVDVTKLLANNNAAF